jgi:hypothetical protein
MSHNETLLSSTLLHSIEYKGVERRIYNLPHYPNLEEYVCEI